MPYLWFGCLWGFFFFLAVLRGMLDPSSPTRDQTRTPRSGSTEF